MNTPLDKLNELLKTETTNLKYFHENEFFARLDKENQEESEKDEEIFDFLTTPKNKPSLPAVITPAGVTIEY